jgi:hypothetical protein
MKSKSVLGKRNDFLPQELKGVPCRIRTNNRINNGLVEAAPLRYASSTAGYAVWQTKARCVKETGAIVEKLRSSSSIILFAFFLFLIAGCTTTGSYDSGVRPTHLTKSDRSINMKAIKMRGGLPKNN